MEHLLLRPLTLIHIVAVLRETSEVDDTEVTAAGWKSVRSWLTYIVEASPDELTAHEVIMLHHIPSFLVRTTPRSMEVVVCRALERRV